MAVQTKAIKRRIKSVKNTRKITKAMELVAASKMRRAVQSTLASRPFSTFVWETVQRIINTTSATHPFLVVPKEATKTLLLVIASDRGLAGGYNTSVLKRATQEVRSIEGEIDAVVIGKRAGDAIRRMNIPILASFVNLTVSPTFTDVRPVARLLAKEFLTGTYKRVAIVYTDFVSALAQQPSIQTLLPLHPDLFRESEEEKQQASFVAFETTLEPNSQAVLERLLPRLVETTVYQSVLESSASEHSSRMLAMKNASEAAGEMIDSLTFAFNQARQAGITQEIAEISSGKAALET